MDIILHYEYPYNVHTKRILILYDHQFLKKSLKLRPCPYKNNNNLLKKTDETVPKLRTVSTMNSSHGQLAPQVT